jgi:hypothetical protein
LKIEFTGTSFLTLPPAIISSILKLFVMRNLYNSSITFVKFSRPF